MPSLLLIAPCFLLFELLQLVISERYLGIKQIARQGDPRAMGLSEVTAFFWSGAIFAYWGWMLLLLVSGLSRVHALSLIAITLIGFSLRRRCGLNWVLVILTLEGAIRIGLLLSLTMLGWRHA